MGASRGGERDKAFLPSSDLSCQTRPTPTSAPAAPRLIPGRLPALGTWWRPLPASQTSCLSPKPELERQTDIHRTVLPTAETSEYGGKKAPLAGGLGEGERPACGSSAGPTGQGAVTDASGSDNSREEPPLLRQHVPRGLQSALSRVYTRGHGQATSQSPGAWPGSETWIRSCVWAPPVLRDLVPEALSGLPAAPTAFLSFSGLTGPFPVAELGSTSLDPTSSGKPLPTPPFPLHTLTHSAAFLWGQPTPRVRSVHNHLSPHSTVTPSQQDLRLSVQRHITSAQHGAHTPSVTGQESRGLGFEPGS